MGGRSQFDRYLDIIFSAFGYKGQDETGLKTDAESIEFAGRLMNMVIQTGTAPCVLSLILL